MVFAVKGHGLRFTIVAVGASFALGACRERERPPAPAPAQPAPAVVPQGPSQPAGHQRMVAELKEVAARSAEDNIFQGKRDAREKRLEVERLGKAAPWKLRGDLGLAELKLGHEQAGTAILEQLRKDLADGSVAGDAAARNWVDFNLGVAWLRVGETQNCCARRGPDSCLLPIQGGGIHTQKEGSTNAARCFLEVAETQPPGSYWQLAGIWLLNLAHMTLGDWPDAVPERLRIPKQAFTSAVPFPRFPNIAADLGLDTFNLAGGVIADDFDHDGCIDLITSSWEADGPLRFFHNDRDGTFTERAVAAGLSGITGGLNLVQADYDNDGNLDFLVLRGAWLRQGGQIPKSLLHNNGDGTFTDVTFAAGLGSARYPSQTAAWADYDNDGWLDLYIGNESSQEFPCACQLFHNNGNGTFTEVAARAGVQNGRYTKGVSWGDCDGDGWIDLYVSNQGGPNRLYHNNGDGTFTDVAKAAGVEGASFGFATWFWDFDNDGALDIYSTCYQTGIGHLAAYCLGKPVECPLAKLYRGDGKGHFTDVAKQMGLTAPAQPMGVNFGDLDGDGWLDFYLGTGDPEYYSLMPNVMYLNREGKQFADVTYAGGFGNLQKGHAIAFADLDNDGDVDVFSELGGAVPGDRFANALYENPGFGNHWLTVQCVGTQSNRSAIGARLRIDIVEDGKPRTLCRHINSGASFGSNPLRQTIGLGKATAVTRIEVLWPRTHKTQVLENVAMDRAIRITEGKDGCEELTLPKITFRRR